MDQLNFYIFPVVALIPLLLGGIWYNAHLFGTHLDQPIHQIGTFGSIKKVALCYLFGLFLTYILALLCVHQIHPFLLFFGEPLMADPNYDAHVFLANFMEQYGDRHRSFGHGLIHGLEFGLFISLTFISGTALIEGKSLKQSWVHIGFWVLCSAIMGGILAAFL